MLGYGQAYGVRWWSAGMATKRRDLDLNIGIPLFGNTRRRQNNLSVVVIPAFGMTSKITLRKAPSAG